MAIKKYCIEGELYSANAIQKELKRILNDTPLEKEVQGKDLTFVLEAFKTATYYEEYIFRSIPVHFPAAY